MITQTNAESFALLSHNWLKGLGSTVLDLLFPPHCANCQRFGTWLCADCLAAVEVIEPPVCRCCGLPLRVPSRLQAASLGRGVLPGVGYGRRTDPVCGNCRNTPPDLDGLRACAYLRGPMRVAIHQFKYNGLRCLALPLAELMNQGWSTLCTDNSAVTVIVPVPLHRTRERERGYNQAALLADELALRLGLPVAGDVLIRTKATTPQVGLSPEERRANVQGAFSCVRDSLADARVLLIDDVYTTGSTLEAAAVALRDGGVLSVWAYTLARAG